MTTTRLVTAQVTEDGPLQGAEIRIERAASCEHRWMIDVHLDAIGSHPARWVPLQDVDQYLADLADAEPLGDTLIDAALDAAQALADDEAACDRLIADPLAETARYCGAWHNPDADGIGDANCARKPGHDPKLPHSGMGGDPLWFDSDPTANLIADPFAETAASHAARAAARTERRAHDAG